MPRQADCRAGDRRPDPSKAQPTGSAAAGMCGGTRRCLSSIVARNAATTLPMPNARIRRAQSCLTPSRSCAAVEDTGHGSRCRNSTCSRPQARNWSCDSGGGHQRDGVITAEAELLRTICASCTVRCRRSPTRRHKRRFSVCCAGSRATQARSRSQAIVQTEQQPFEGVAERTINSTRNTPVPPGARV